MEEDNDEHGDFVVDDADVNDDDNNTVVELSKKDRFAKDRLLKKKLLLILEMPRFMPVLVGKGAFVGRIGLTSLVN